MVLLRRVVRCFVLSEGMPCLLICLMLPVVVARRLLCPVTAVVVLHGTKDSGTQLTHQGLRRSSRSCVPQAPGTTVTGSGLWW